MFSNFYKLSKTVDEGSLGIDQKTLRKGRKIDIMTRYKQKRFRVDNLIQKGKKPE